MAEEFEVSFDKAYEELLRVRAQIAGVGHELDKLNKARPSGMIKQMGKMGDSVKLFAERMKSHGSEVSEAFISMSKEDVAKKFLALANQAHNTSLKLSALRNSGHDLHGVFKQMANDKNSIRYYEEMATSTNRLRTEFQRLQLKQAEMNTLSGQSNVIMRQVIADTKRQIIEESRLTDVKTHQASMISKVWDAAHAENIRRTKSALAKVEAAEAASIEKRMAMETSAHAENSTRDKAAYQRRLADITSAFEKRASLETSAHSENIRRDKSATDKRASLEASAYAENLNRTKSALDKRASLEAAAHAENLNRTKSALDKRTALEVSAYAENERRKKAVLNKLAADEAAAYAEDYRRTQSALDKRAQAETQAYAEEYRRRKAALDKLAQAEIQAHLEDRKRSEQALVAKKSSADATKILSRAEIEAAARTRTLQSVVDAVNNSIKMNAESSQRAAVSTNQMDTAFRKVSASIRAGNLGQANNELAKMGAQAGSTANSVRLLTKADAELAARNSMVTKMVELRNRSVKDAAAATVRLTSDQKNLVNQLHQEALANQASAKLNNSRIRGLLGMSTASDKATHSMRLQQQAASALRATLSGLHASIGMYTSATILAATAAYAISAAIRDTVTSSVEFGETMSRVQAIMFSGANTYGSVADNMSAVDAQIRALGQSTIFTSNEVAKGMVDLGMAGLNATQAMEGLKPALDLASIGQLDMSRSADIVTNVLTTFKMEATELTDVVDVMATAVTNSNTNVEQLANAITYVGPAAQAAGFSLKDTVATIELLSNAGIKASKAGTGLRRFMLNLLNPTKKGQAVIDKYNISLYKMNGETRDLTDIIRQFGGALMADGVTPAERMAAIVDLVGVRAASAVSRMVSSFDQLELVRYQLDNVTGAADDMRRTIEDNLGSDWKKVISAFSEVQKQAFDPFENNMRLLAAEATVFMQDLLEPFDQVKEVTTELGGLSLALDDTLGGLAGPAATDGITKATMLVYTLRDLAMAGVMLGAAFAAAKIGTFAGALAGADKGSLASAGRVVSAAMASATRGVAAMTLSAQLNITATLGMGGASGIASAAVNTLGLSALFAIKGVNALAIAVTWFGRAMAVALPFIGWVAAIVSVGYAIKYMLKDSEDHLDEHAKKVAGVREKYIDLQRQIDVTQGRKTQSALEQQLTNTMTEIDKTKTYIEELKLVISGMGEGAALDRLNLELKTAQYHLSEMDKAADNARKKLKEYGSSIVDVHDTSKAYKALVAEIAEVENKLATLEKQTGQTRGATVHARNETARLKRELDALQGKLQDTGNKMVEVRNKADTMAVAFKKAADAAYDMKYAETIADGQTNFQKRIAALEKISELEKEIKKWDDIGQEDGDAAGFEKRQKAGMELIEQREALAELNAENKTLIGEMTREQAKQDKEGLIAVYNMAKAQGELSEVIVKKNLMLAQAQGGAFLQEQAWADLKDEEAAIKSRIQDLQSAADRTASKGMNSLARKAKTAADKMDKRVDDMIERLFPDRAIEVKFTEDLETLKALAAREKMSKEDTAAAKKRIVRDKDDEMSRNNPDSDLGRRLSEDYLGVSTTAMELEQDRSRLATQYGGTSMQEIADQSWKSQRKESVIGDAPDLASDSLGAGDSNKIAQHREELDTWHKEQIAKEAALYEQMKELKAGQKEDEFNADVAHKERLQVLEAEHTKKLERLDQVSNQVRMKDTAALFGGMAELSATMVGDSSRLTQGLLAFQQAASIAATIQSMSEATAKGFAQLGPIAGAAAAAGMVAQTATLLSTLGSIVSPSEPDTSTSTYSGAYDKGGYIGAGQYGVVGEYGPELVHGPAAITGRKETAKMYGENNSGGSVSIAPQISISVEQKGNSEDARVQGKDIAAQVSAAVLQTLQNETRPNGYLDKWKRGNR